MQRPNPETVTLNDILITQELSRRAARPPNLQAENQAMRMLIHQMTQGAESLMQTLVDTALELCQAGTTGLSLLETTADGAEIFRWNALAGTLAHHVGGSTPRNFSPCGVCLDQGSPVLFSHPERYFIYFQEANIPIVEGLVLPLIADNHVFGMIWIMSHDEGRHFDSEDVRVMTSLADFTATALLLQQRQTGELLAANVALETEIVERKQVEARTQALIANLPGGAVFVVDRALRYLLAEGEALSTAGFKPEDLVGQTIFEVLPPELAASYEPLYRQALTGESFEHEHYAHHHTYLSRGTPLRSEDGEVYAVLAVSFDITDRKRVEDERKQTEQELTKTNQLLQATFDSSLQDIQLFKAVRDERGDIVDFEWLLTNKQWNDQWGEMAGKRLLTENPAVVETGLFEMFKQVTESGVPIRHERHYAYEQFDGWFWQTIAQVEDGFLLSTTDITERKRAEAALRQSEEKYRSLFTTMDQGFCLIEKVETPEGQPSDFRYLTVNPAFERHTGIHNVVGKTIREFVPDVEQRIIDIYDDVVRTGQPHRFEEYVSALDFWIEAEVFPAQVLGRIAVLFSNISDRKRAEQTLRESEARQAFLLQLSDALRAEPDADAVANRALQMISEQMQLDRCYIGVYRPADDRGDFTHQVGNDRVPPLPDGVRLSDFPDALRVAFDRTLVIDNVTETEGLTDTDRQNLSALGLYALVAATLRQGENNPLWSIVAVSGSPRHWTWGEVALLEEVTERTWFAIERTRAETAVEAELRATQMLHNLATRLISEEDRQALYQEIVKTAIALTQADAGSFQILDETTQELVIMATQGIDQIMADHFHRLDASSNTSCGIALTSGERTFIHFDVPESEDPDGSLRIHREAGFCCVQSTPLRSRSGKPIGMFSTHWREDHRLSDRELRFLDLLARQAADIVEQRQAEENRIQLIQEQAAREQERQRAESLAELDRAKTNFFSNISHEFRTPLTLSLAPLQDALKSVDEWMDRSVDENPSTHLPTDLSSIKHNLELAHRNSLRLLKLVNTLLDFSRIEAGRMEAVYEPIDLATFTTELSSVFRSAIQRAGLQLIVDCPPLPEPVFVDREMWEKIVLNLLSNAFKFTFEGVITVRLRPADNNQVILQIQDTGTGIAPEHLPHLFERFYQVRSTQARTHEGSGIGLALVHELVRLHGGTIDVSSILGEGTCFTIALTFGTNHLPSDRLQDEGDRPSVRTLASTAMGANVYVEEAERWLPEETEQEAFSFTPDSLLPTLPSARVLVVDDNADMREYLNRILSEHVQVEVVADGTTALAVAQAQVPDLILSDVMMPGLDGFELLGALRTDPRTREIPIILLSARAGEEAIVEGLEAGADDYLIKPFSAQELVSRVTAHLQMAQLRGEALQEARSTLRSRDEFISVVSHELNTPLVSILGWTRMLRSSPPNPVMLSKALDTIERNATLQGKLVQDLLDISRVTAGKLRLNPQPIELQPVIETAIATVTQPAADKGIHLTWQENVTEPVVVMGDRDRLSQVLINLLTNAIKFTPESGNVTLELSVVSNDASYAEVRVSDTGIGITADFLPHVFDRFRQAEGAHSVKGLGLGLAIARHIVELHNGTIHADSTGEGQGAIFTIRLPLLQDSTS